VCELAVFNAAVMKGFASFKKYFLVHTQCLLKLCRKGNLHFKTRFSFTGVF